jgi:hypothetical protein
MNFINFQMKNGDLLTNNNIPNNNLNINILSHPFNGFIKNS